MKCVLNKKFSANTYQSFLLTESIIKEVKSYHESFEAYHETDLISLKALSKMLGIEMLYVKDESSRFSLNAFKVLGATYAVGKALAKELGEDISQLPFETLKKRVKEELGEIKLAATTDGNHGRGVAWMGKQLGLEVVIYMPKGTTKNRLQHILDEGAKATIMEMNYDDTVRWVAEKAKENNWLIIQDTAWEGYEDVPIWIMQGYATMAREVIAQLGNSKPTHVFLQAGVGAFAAVIAEALYNHYGVDCPKIIIVEAEVADCYYRSAVAEEEVKCGGDLNTIMAGLACGEANPIGYKVLFQLASAFISAPDWVAANGMRIMGNPIKGDASIVSGESGAVCVGVVEAVLREPKYKEIKEALEINNQSKILTFSTEGDTDQQVYREIMWYGRNSGE